MKKFILNAGLSLLALVASAQTPGETFITTENVLPSASMKSSTKTELLENDGAVFMLSVNGRYLAPETEGEKVYVRASTLSSGETIDSAYFWQLECSTGQVDGKVTSVARIKNAATGLFLGAPVYEDVKEKITLTYEAEAATYAFSDEASWGTTYLEFWVPDNQGGLGLDVEDEYLIAGWDEVENSWRAAKIKAYNIAANDIEQTHTYRYVKLTYPAYEEGGEAVERVVALEDGTNLSSDLPQMGGFSTTGVSGRNKIVSATNYEFSVLGQWTAPSMIGVIDEGLVYNLCESSMGGSGNYLTGSQSGFKTEGTDGQAPLTDNGVFYFTTRREGPVTYITINNFGLGGAQCIEFDDRSLLSVELVVEREFTAKDGTKFYALTAEKDGVKYMFYNGWLVSESTILQDFEWETAEPSLDEIIASGEYGVCFKPVADEYYDAKTSFIYDGKYYHVDPAKREAAKQSHSLADLRAMLSRSVMEDGLDAYRDWYVGIDFADTDGSISVPGFRPAYSEEAQALYAALAAEDEEAVKAAMEACVKASATADFTEGVLYKIMLCNPWGRMLKVIGSELSYVDNPGISYANQATEYGTFGFMNIDGHTYMFDGETGALINSWIHKSFSGWADAPEHFWGISEVPSPVELLKFDVPGVIISSAHGMLTYKHGNDYTGVHFGVGTTEPDEDVAYNNQCRFAYAGMADEAVLAKVRADIEAAHTAVEGRVGSMLEAAPSQETAVVNTPVLAQYERLNDAEATHDQLHHWLDNPLVLKIENNKVYNVQTTDGKAFACIDGTSVLTDYVAGSKEFNWLAVTNESGTIFTFIHYLTEWPTEEAALLADDQLSYATLSYGDGVEYIHVNYDPAKRGLVSNLANGNDYVVTKVSDDPADADRPSSITEIETSASAATELFDLNGRRVNSAARTGIYIERRGAKSTKRFVR